MISQMFGERDTLKTFTLTSMKCLISSIFISPFDRISLLLQLRRMLMDSNDKFPSNLEMNSFYYYLVNIYYNENMGFKWFYRNNIINVTQNVSLLMIAQYLYKTRIKKQKPNTLVLCGVFLCLPLKRIYLQNISNFNNNSDTNKSNILTIYRNNLSTKNRKGTIAYMVLSTIKSLLTIKNEDQRIKLVNRADVTTNNSYLMKCGANIVFSLILYPLNNILNKSLINNESYFNSFGNMLSQYGIITLFDGYLTHVFTILLDNIILYLFDQFIEIDFYKKYNLFKINNIKRKNNIDMTGHSVFCDICLVKKKQYTFKNCGHCSCEICYKKLRNKCHMCRQKIKSVHKIVL